MHNSRNVNSLYTVDVFFDYCITFSPLPIPPSLVACKNPAPDVCKYNSFFKRKRHKLLMPFSVFEYGSLETSF